MDLFVTHTDMESNGKPLNGNGYMISRSSELLAADRKASLASTGINDKSILLYGKAFSTSVTDFNFVDISFCNIEKRKYDYSIL